MSHKIRLTGVPVSELRKINGIYSFDMQEKGGIPAEGLPVSGTIEYTVFVNKSQLVKAGITKDNINYNNIFVEGDPCLDIPIDICPGEIGVSCTELLIIPADTNIQDSIDIKKDKPTKKINPPAYDEIVPFKYIVLPKVLPEQAHNSFTHIVKFYNEHGFLDKPLYVTHKAGKLLLVNSFMQYFAAKEMKLERVPVKFTPYNKKSVPEGTEDIILLSKIVVPDEFINSKPAEHKIKKAIKDYRKFDMISKPLLIEKDTYKLLDGYTRYCAMKQIDIPYVPVRYAN